MTAKPGLFVRTMLPEDLLALDLQDVQSMWHGEPLTAGYGRTLLTAGPCWTVLRASGAPAAVCGFAEQHEFYAVAWTLLGRMIGRDHLELTRMVREALRSAPYTRIEALVRPDHLAGMRWAELLGFEQAFRVRGCRPDGGDLELFEMVRQ